MKKKFMILTDWRKPYVSWLVTVLEKLEEGLKKRGFDVIIVSPLLFKTLPLPWYKEIKVAVFPRNKLKKIILSEMPDYIHIVWEWPIWWTAINICNKYSLKYTSSFHSKFPEYVYLRTKLPISTWYNILRKFHENSERVLVTTNSLKKELEERGFKKIWVYPLWVDSERFKRLENIDLWYKKPIFVYMWRVAVEKNIEAFLKLNTPWTKLVIWDGPLRKKLEEEYNDAKFVWYKSWKQLVKYLSWSDVFVFPSMTDTFWLSILEAMSCWLPVIAYNITWPKDIITNSFDWFIWEDLQENIKKGLTIDKKNPMKTANKYSWDNMVDKFLEYQVLSK